MEVLIIMVLLGLVLMLCMVDESPGSLVAMILSMVATIVMLSGKTEPLNTNTDYMLVGEYHSSSSSILELHSRNWASIYTYKVNCVDIKGGSCPNPWPKRFKTVMDGNKFVIVPIESAEPKSEK